ncbi:MAG: hypothetical protein O7A98_06970 [Acidobacteria bacterium]|nr:hypothetical protein [Acidobacteriota bacterium]
MRRSSYAWLVLPLAFAASASAWDTDGHYRVAEDAVLALPAEVPEFFRWGASTVAHTAIDPDVMKHRETPQLRHREYPEHFLDYEFVSAWPLPELRYDFVALTIEHGLKPDQVGFAPWSVTENAQRLSLAFAEFRCWPENPHIRSKALVYAGLMAHYAGDMQQPLHTSMHYDGRANAEGESPRSGIHRKVDSLFGQPGFDPGELESRIEAYDDLWTAVKTAFAASHALVDTVYELEPALDALYENGQWGAELRSFSRGRYRATVDFLASLYLTAWRQSGEIGISPWMRRKGPDGMPQACAVSE